MYKFEFNAQVNRLSITTIPKSMNSVSFRKIEDKLYVINKKMR